ncbi:MAG TPA: ACT domain-containing protein [Polyangiaceae bacterium]|jgi:glycine cleavage system transcriptional repressor|nr:ACT domain-containing protein [Polyangiaceae bacterium]
MAEKNYLVLTAVGPDRPGLVSEMSSLVHSAGANLEDSRMAILGGEFALLMLVSGQAEAVARVEQSAEELGNRLGLRVLTKPTSPQSARDFLPYQIRVTGVDRPGIVQRVAAVLAGRGVNVASLESRLSYAPLSGTPMFILEAALQIPSALALSDLRRELASASEEENWDFTLEGG